MSVFPGAEGVLFHEGESGALAMGREGAAPGGVDDRGALEEDEPVTWETRVVLVHNPADGEPVILPACGVSWSASWRRGRAGRLRKETTRSHGKGRRKGRPERCPTAARESEG